MSDGYDPSNYTNETTTPPPGEGKPSSSTDQVIGDATTVMSSFMKEPVSAIRMAWDNKKIGIALIVGAAIVAIQLVYSIISNLGLGYNVRFGYMLGSWLRASVTQLAVLALLAFVCMLLVKGHCNSGYVGALAGVGTAALLPVVGMVIRTVFLLIAKILPFWLFQFISGIVSAAVGTPMYVAMFILLAMTIQRKTGATRDYMIARNTIILAGVYYVAAYVIAQLIR